MDIVKDDITETKAIYDPRKDYTWDKDSIFTLNGSEFGLIMNTLRKVVSTEEATTILLADKACQVIEQIMTKSVENGVIKEIVK